MDDCPVLVMPDYAGLIATETEVLATMTACMRGDPVDKERMHAAEVLAKIYGMFDREPEPEPVKSKKWRLPVIIDDIADAAGKVLRIPSAK